MILIVGGGIAGLSAAYALRRRTEAPIVLLTGKVDAASAVPKALLNLHRGRSARIDPRDREGYDAMLEVAGELEKRGHRSGLHLTGISRIAMSDAQVKRWRHTLVRSSSGISFFDTESNSRKIEAPHGGFQVRVGGWVETRVHRRSLRRCLIEDAVELVDNTQALSIRERQGSYVITTDKSTLEADIVISATGAANAPWFPATNYRRVSGSVLSLEVEDSTGIITPVLGSAYAIPDRTPRNERWELGGFHAADPSDLARSRAELWREAASMIPALARARPLEIWQGVRAASPDNHPEIHRLGPSFWHLGNFAGRGYLTAHGMARRLARDVIPEA